MTFKFYAEPLPVFGFAELDPLKLNLGEFPL